MQQTGGLGGEARGTRDLGKGLSQRMRLGVAPRAQGGHRLLRAPQSDRLMILGGGATWEGLQGGPGRSGTC